MISAELLQPSTARARPLGKVAKVEWGNTSITKASYVESGFTAFSATGPDGFLPSAQWHGEGIVLSAIGARCGKCFLADGDWTAIKNTIVIQGDESRINNRFLFYFLNDARRWKIAGSGQPFITLKTARAVCVPVPPLDEQQRIVAEIETQFTRLDVGVASLKRMQSELKRYRASVLKAACEGRLGDGAKEYLTLPKGLLELAESDDAIASAEEKLPSLPTSWHWLQVGKVFQTRQGVQIPKSEHREAACPGFKRYLYISDFKHSESLKFVEDKFPNQEVTERDLVMANTGSPGEVFLGTCGILSNNLFRLSFDAEHFAQRFVYYYFKSPLFLSRIKMKGGAQQHLGHRTIAAHLIPVPPLAQQVRIVAEVERRLSVVEELESVVSASLQRATRLRQSTLHKAFNGAFTG